jgi:hypothetical protein
MTFCCAEDKLGNATRQIEKMNIKRKHFAIKDFFIDTPFMVFVLYKESLLLCQSLFSSMHLRSDQLMLLFVCPKVF